MVLVRSLTPQGPNLAPAEIGYQGDETISGSFGTIDCRRISLKVGESEVDLWYEKAGTGRLIRYQAPESSVVMELIPANPNQAPN